MYMLIPFASIALSTIAGGGEIARTGYAYIKTMLVYAFEIVLMAVVLAIAGSFLMGSSVLDSGDNLQLVYVCLLYTSITCIHLMKRQWPHTRLMQIITL